MSSRREQSQAQSVPPQRIIKVRRDYNKWVADETIEDYALRFTARSFRKWSELSVANTALGATSFLALEAIGGSITLNDGFVNAFWAIVAVAAVIFFTGLPIAYYASKYGVDMDLLTRGAGFGYIGSTITSIIYASFTFLFLAIEAAIMALALQMYFAIPITVCYLVSALVIVPLVAHGFTLISRLQMWTQPLWLALLVLPYVFVLLKNPDLPHQLVHFAGASGTHGHFNVLLFGSAAGIALSLIAQIGEQVDYLRFIPERTQSNRRRWITGMLVAGPGWILLGSLKLLGGALLAYLTWRSGIALAAAEQPTQMYLTGFRQMFASPALALVATTLFVVVSQIKINVTNAYAGSLAWSNFFARITHSHPGRVVWLVFNVLIALMLMELGVFKALDQVLGFYSNVAISWVGALVADLVINKPLGLSPAGIEFKRACLYDINPVGVGAMVIASTLSILAFCGVFGVLAQAFSAFIALASAFALSPLLAWLTRGRFYLTPRVSEEGSTSDSTQRCCICEKSYEAEDMAFCPAYRGNICSLCCSLDVRCHDLCKPGGSLSDQLGACLRWLLPSARSVKFNRRLGHYLLLVLLMAAGLAAVLALIYTQQRVAMDMTAPSRVISLRMMFLKLYAAFLLLGGVGCWLLVLTSESRRMAQEESNRQTHLLMREIEAHKRTDEQLQHAKQAAERANLAKSRYISGISHELRTPLNSILGYAQIVEHDYAIPPHRREAMTIIHRSGEHLLSLIDGLLDIARIEAGRLTLEVTQLRLPEFIDQIADMFRLQARSKGIRFIFDKQDKLPPVVRVDKKRLGQILINVLGNAIKFTERGSVTLRVRYRRQIAVFEVEDTGIGIATEDLERIFLPFERGSNAARYHQDSTGQGLTIAKLLAELMGGDLGAQSSPSGGSVFRLKLLLPEVLNPLPAADLPTLDISGYEGPRRRVLVVDDEAVDRELLVNVLEPLGFEVAKAGCGVDALRRVVDFKPDLILLDVSMPDIDGWQTGRLLRSNNLSYAPILIISANAFDKGRNAAPGVGVDDFFVKPIDLRDLLARVREKLDLTWINRTPDEASHPAVEAPAVLVRPPPEDLDHLRYLGRIGYIRGILDKLDEIDRQYRECAELTKQLRRCARRFQMTEYFIVLERMKSNAVTRS